MIMKFLEAVGRRADGVVNATGSMAIMLGQAVMFAFVPPVKLRNIFKQMSFVGVESVYVVILTGTFTGMVLALQSFNALKRFGAESLVSPTVALSMARELGPVLTGLMVTGRAGSAMATELGTMRLTEQIDALVTMAVNPVRYLVTPRVIAGVTMFPLLTIIADFSGVVGGYVVGVKFLGINSAVYTGRIMDFVTVHDIFYGLKKSLVFGVITATVACFHGFYAKGGAEGVGRAATGSVVMGSILILMSDYLLSSLMTY